MPTTWTEPTLISEMRLSNLSLAVDSLGRTHIAAAQSAEMAQGIWYITNASGTWTTTEVAPVRGRYDTAYTRPILTLDTDDSVWIAFTKESCPPDRCVSSDIAYVTNVSGEWADPVPVDLVEHDLGLESIAVRDGIVHLAYTKQCFLGWNNEIGVCADTSYFAPLYYATNDGGEWTSRLILKRGGATLLTFDEPGNARMLISPMVHPPREFVASFETADFAVEPIWQDTHGLPSSATPLWFEEDSAGALGAAWNCWCDPDVALYYTVRRDNSWPKPAKLVTGTVTTSAGLTASDVLEFVGADTVGDEDASYIYGDTSTGANQTRVIAPNGARDSGWGLGAPGSIGLGLDAAGRPHIAYILYSTETTGPLWYVEGPSPG